MAIGMLEISQARAISDGALSHLSSLSTPFYLPNGHLPGERICWSNDHRSRELSSLVEFASATGLILASPFLSQAQSLGGSQSPSKSLLP